jgi:hypothetical protein
MWPALPGHQEALNNSSHIRGSNSSPPSREGVAAATGPEGGMWGRQHRRLHHQAGLQAVVVLSYPLLPVQLQHLVV